MVLETRHLQVVRAVAEAGSVTRAAALLGVSQPSLTGQLQRIENRLGGLLFVRDRRGAVPTPLGEFVLAKARQVLPAMEALHHESLRYNAQGEEQRRIRYGAVPGPLMAGTLRRLGEQSPGEVTLRTETSSAMLVQLIAHQALEFASVLDHVERPLRLGAEIGSRVIAVEPAMALLPESHPLARRPEVEIAQLADATWVVPPMDDNGLRECLLRLCAEAGFTPRIAHETEATGARDLISEGHGVGLGQATFRDTAGIAVRGLARTPLSIRHILIWRRGVPGPALVEEVAAHAAAAYTAAVARSPAYLNWLERHPGYPAGADLPGADPERPPGPRGPAPADSGGLFRR
ncbi:LysR family transcriptional regulator [Streptomyces physcomitrii]|uniref:LysR substrate-binding domain-containing protein n=1 Tax=Streptomyces physcomitrii TaxID=2724184 RepID=UPI00344515E7